jgi:hypothetical protein
MEQSKGCKLSRELEPCLKTLSQGTSRFNIVPAVAPIVGAGFNTYCAHMSFHFYEPMLSQCVHSKTDKVGVIGARGQQPCGMPIHSSNNEELTCQTKHTLFALYPKEGAIQVPCNTALRACLHHTHTCIP